MTILFVLICKVDPGRHILVKKKILNMWGLLYALSAFGIAVFMTPLMAVLAVFCDLFGDKNRRRLLDWVVHLWANFAMTLVGYRPKLIGLENLPVRLIYVCIIMKAHFTDYK